MFPATKEPKYVDKKSVSVGSEKEKKGENIVISGTESAAEPRATW